MRPFAGYVGGGVRGVDQRVVVFRPFAAFDFQHFLFDLFQGGDEAVEFGFALALGRLDHQRAGNGEGDGRGVEALVHQAFGDVERVNAFAGLFFVRENDFVHRIARKRFVERVRQTVSDVARIQDS